MSKKQFTFIKDTVATNLKTPIVFDNETMSIGEVLDKLNGFADENEQLKGEVTHYKLILMSLEQEAKRISKIR